MVTKLFNIHGANIYKHWIASCSIYSWWLDSVSTFSSACGVLDKPKLSLKVLKKKMCLWFVLTYSIGAVGQYVSCCVCRLSPVGLEIENEDEEVKEITLKIKYHKVTKNLNWILNHHILGQRDKDVIPVCLITSYQELSAICIRAVVLIQIKHNCTAL